MCRADGADNYPEFFEEVTRTARKKHWCGECRRTIQIGEMYHAATGKWDGDVRTEKTCVHCRAASAWLVRECRNYLFTEVYADLREHWVEGGIHTRELASLIWGMGRKWRRRDGTLMPVPVVASKVEVTT